MFFIKTFDSKISWNINKIYFKTFSHPFQIGFISYVIQTISYKISIQTLSYQIQNQIHFKYIFLWLSNIKWCPVTFISNPKSNTFQIYFFSGYQISNGAQLCGTFKWVASRKLFLLRWTEPNTTSTSNL